jgi:hypothetical protein
MNTTTPRMWDIDETSRTHLSHDMPCPHCGHATHTYLALLTDPWVMTDRGGRACGRRG